MAAKRRGGKPPQDPISTQVGLPKSVLIYSLSWLPGQVDGIAVRMMAQVQELVERGVKVTLMVPSYDLPGQALSVSADKPKHTMMPGVELVLLDTMPMPVYEKNCCAAVTFKNLSTIISTIRRVKPELVHFTQCASIVMFATACIICDVPIIVSMHTDVTQIANRDGGFSARFGGRVGGMLRWVSIFCVNGGYLASSYLGARFFTVSLQARAILKDASVSDCCIFPEVWGPMVDRQTFCIDQPKDQVEETRQRLTFGLPDAYLMVCPGRVTAEKDIQFLVDSLKRAPKNVVLALIGSGSMAQELAKLHGKEHRLYCTGEFVGRQEVALALRAADCCVSASVMETVGFTAMEALSCGTPMLAANAQGFALHLSHGVNARLFAPADEKSFDEELATLMKTKHEGAWSKVALRQSMEHAALPECTDRALCAYVFAMNRPKRNLLQIAGTRFLQIGGACALFFSNMAIFALPVLLRRFGFSS
ncbi:unnamed protein product [Polarella glacialis]|uniref:Glycosyltransferase subfamily 4-like N-terminal domain-containing protein n=1 Tax=Polarella glacialis TaxID=89957 RepID=A0A813FBD6_POLGL|nr:unnamed protein product [Polarella glacialis]